MGYTERISGPTSTSLPADPPRIGAVAPTEPVSWSDLYVKDEWKSWDFRVSAVAGIGTVLFALRKDAFGDESVVLLASIAAIAAALLAVTLTAMAIIANISSSYRRSLMMLPGGLRGALAPYQLVAAVCGASTLAPLAGLALVNVSGPHWLRALGAGLIAFLITWSVAGTVDLVNMTALHGRGDASVDPDRQPGSIA